LLDNPIPPKVVIFFFFTNTCELVKNLEKLHIIMACEFIKKIKLDDSDIIANEIMDAFCIN
jgi:hypothetical protein